jgi:hypothetical protein
MTFLVNPWLGKIRVIAGMIAMADVGMPVAIDFDDD